MKFVAPGLAVAAFAVTVGAILLQDHWHSPPPSQPFAPPLSAAVRSGVMVSAAPLSSQSPALEPVSETALPPQDVPAQQGTSDADDEADVAAPQPTLPDSASLPSYEEDQAARNADALQSARSR